MKLIVCVCVYVGCAYGYVCVRDGVRQFSSDNRQVYDSHMAQIKLSKTQLDCTDILANNHVCDHANIYRVALVKRHTTLICMYYGLVQTLHCGPRRPAYNDP